MPTNRNGNVVVVLIAVFAVGAGLWHIYPARYQAETVIPTVEPLVQEVTERIGTTDFYLRYLVGTTTPTLATIDEVTMSEEVPRWNYGLLNTPVKTFKENVLPARADGVSMFFTEGLDAVINDNGSSVIFTPETFTNAFKKAEYFRRDIHPTEYDEITVLEKFTSGTRTAYLIRTLFSGTGNGLCGAGEEENLFLATVGPAGNHITTGYPYNSCKFGLADGDVSYYREGEHFLVSNNNSVMYMNFAHPEWGLITKDDLNW